MGDGIPWLGTVNKNDLIVPTLGTFPAGTLLLEGADDKRLQRALDGVGLNDSLRWDVTLPFAYTPRG